MKKLKTRKDFGEKTNSIYDAITQNMPTSEHEEARNQANLSLWYMITQYNKMQVLMFIFHQRIITII